MAGAVLLGVLDLFPVGPDLIDIFDFQVAEHVRMAADQLLGDMPRDPREVERAAFPGQLTMEDNLQEQISQFLNHLMVVAGFDGVHEFIDLLDGVVSQRHVVLLPVPRTAGGRAEPGHDFEQVVDGGVLFHDPRKLLRHIASTEATSNRVTDRRNR